MISKLPTEALSLTQFMRRRKVLNLYRDILRTIYRIEDLDQREYMFQWAKNDFKKNKQETDNDSISIMITRGQKTLREMSMTIGLAK